MNIPPARANKVARPTPSSMTCGDAASPTKARPTIGPTMEKNLAHANAPRADPEPTPRRAGRLELAASSAPPGLPRNGTLSKAGPAMALTRRALLGAGISAGLWAWRSDASAEASKPTPGPDGFFALDAAPASLEAGRSTRRAGARARLQRRRARPAAAHPQGRDAESSAAQQIVRAHDAELSRLARGQRLGGDRRPDAAADRARRQSRHPLFAARRRLQPLFPACRRRFGRPDIERIVRADRRRGTLAARRRSRDDRRVVGLAARPVRRDRGPRRGRSRARRGPHRRCLDRQFGARPAARRPPRRARASVSGWRTRRPRA